jgi:hypothetical protein
LSHIQPNRIREYWDLLQAELKKGNLDLETWALEPTGGHFYARAVSDRVFIEGKGIKGIRTVGFPEFEKAAKQYNDYVDSVAGVKQKLRDDVGYNTSYILTLIHYALEVKASAPTEQEPEKPKKPEKIRVRHYRSRRGG